MGKSIILKGVGFSRNGIYNPESLKTIYGNDFNSLDIESPSYGDFTYMLKQSCEYDGIIKCIVLKGYIHTYTTQFKIKLFDENRQFLREYIIDTTNAINEGGICWLNCNIPISKGMYCGWWINPNNIDNTSFYYNYDSGETYYMAGDVGSGQLQSIQATYAIQFRLFI